jgi:hypothetical protein
LHHGAYLLAQDQEIGRRAVSTRDGLARGRCCRRLALGPGTRRPGTRRLGAGGLERRRRRDLGPALREFAVHDQHVELTTAAANMEYDLAIDR